MSSSATNFPFDNVLPTHSLGCCSERQVRPFNLESAAVCPVPYIRARIKLPSVSTRQHRDADLCGFPYQSLEPTFGLSVQVKNTRYAFDLSFTVVPLP